MPTYLQDAVKTAIGHADPLSGYQLDVTKGLSSPVAYYKPNSGDMSFIDPAQILTGDGFLMFKRDEYGSGGVSFACHTKYTDITSVDWDFGDGVTQTGGTKLNRHVYPVNGTYTASATIHSVAAGGTKAFTVSVTADQAPLFAPVNTAVPTITGTAVHGNTLTAHNGTWTSNPSGPTFTYQWYWFDTSANIAGATASTYALVVGDETHTVAVKVTATNSQGSTTVSSAATAVIT